MPIVDLLELPRTGPLLGLDPGTKTIGLAACDPDRLVVTPINALKRARKLKPTLDELSKIIEQRRTAALIIGLPLNMDGSRGPRAQAAFALAHQILSRVDLPIAMQDERLSSAEVERAMIDADVSRRKRAAAIDSAAAAIILKAAIDRLQGGI